MEYTLGQKIKGRLRYYSLLYREKVTRKPSHVLLETTNRCNLNCPFCLVGQQNVLVQTHGNTSHDLMVRPMGMMSWDTFELAKKQLKEFGIYNVYLHFQGEPLLHRDLAKMSKSLKDEGFRVMMFTNGLLFNEHNIAPMVESGIDLIRFSVDGATQDIYKQNRVGGQFEVVYENMKKLVKATKGTRTRVEWQFIPMRNNEHEVPKAEQMAKEIGIPFFWKPYRVTDEERAPQQSQYRCTLLKKPCTDIYHQLGIYWNGNVVPCCYDNDGHEVMGNVHEQTLSTIWDSDRYTKFRKQVDNYQNNPNAEPELCTSCLRWGNAKTKDALVETASASSGSASHKEEVTL